MRPNPPVALAIRRGPADPAISVLGMQVTGYTMAFLANANFDSAAGYTPWFKCNLSENVLLAVVQDGSAKSGTAFLRASTTAAGGSVAQDIRSLPNVPSMGVYAWVRASPGAPAPVSGTLTIWELNATGNNNHPNAPFVAGNDWILVANAIDFQQASPNIRVEFYVNNVAPAQLDIDCVIAI